ncbi:bifunctional nuclease in basal defense response 1 [Actinidia rufa]|uniref:Bifunctional nuclease in basal defense response 1 n=1 Tax=Actinidia rufa TaxID=165716 RepID=A0A7J0EI86_9ERIC|nr:bifunctional nuclease in basal defense response 1 [Actinidia rufa]
MSTLQGPVFCPAVQAKQTGAYTRPLIGPLMKAKALKSGFWGNKGISRTNVSHQNRMQQCKKVQCSLSSSSNGNGSMAENFNENDEDYVNSSIVEAVEVKSSPDGFTIKMRDGKNLRCAHNNPQGGHLPDYAPHPAIVLKMEDGTGLLLPIIVLEMPSVLLMAAIRNVPIARPTMYHIVKEMIEKMGYAVKLVRVTKRVHEAYFAQLYLTKLGNEMESISFDLRPSDAINIAVRCKYDALLIVVVITKQFLYLSFSFPNSWSNSVLLYVLEKPVYAVVPIQVNKYLAYSDGMRVIEPAKVLMQASSSDGLLFTELDRPSGQPCIETKEFNLIRNMHDAAVEERYSDADRSNKDGICTYKPIGQSRWDWLQQ